jgi:hypothetical protein
MTLLHPEWLLLQNYGNVKTHLGGETVYVPYHYKEANCKLRAGLDMPTVLKLERCQPKLYKYVIFILSLKYVKNAQ